jgi:N-acyl-D-amino-acid deacylase
MTRRHLRAAAIALLGLLLFTAAALTPAAQQPAPLYREETPIPITGDAGPGLEALDAAVRAMMRRHGIPGGSLAIAYQGRLVFAKGYGFADVATDELARPTILFGLASLSKPITALAILKLIEAGLLGLDSRPFDILTHLEPPRGARVDPRLRSITVRQMLNHSGGWNRMVSGDPINWEPQIARQLGARPPLSPEQFISFMMAQPLDFDPGTQSQYSNVGYIILGQVIEKVSGDTYENYVRKAVLEPAGMRQTAMNHTASYLRGQSLRYLAGSSTPLPPMQAPMVKACGGWNASTIDLVRLLTSLDGSRGKPLLQEKTFQTMLAPPPPPLQPRADGSYAGLGFEMVKTTRDGYSYFQDGSAHGIRTFMKRSEKGVNWALAFNASMNPDLLDRQIAAVALQEVRQAVDSIASHPDIDLFKD